MKPGVCSRLVLLALIGQLPWRPSTPGQQASSATVSQPVAQSRESSETAQLRILLLDDSGRPLTKVSKDAITVQFDKQTAEVQDLQPLVSEPLYFSMLVDVSGSARPTTDAQIIANVRLFRILQKDGDNHGYVVLFNDDIVTAGEGVKTAGAVEQLLRTAEYRGSTALYNTIDYICAKQLSRTILPASARRALVVISDGADTTGRATLKTAITTAQREGVRIFPIVLSTDRKHKREGGRGLKTLKALSESAGGLMARSRRRTNWTN